MAAPFAKKHPDTILTENKTIFSSLKIILY